MAAAIVGKPGSKYGPCIEVCKHTDCAESRAYACAVCTICGDVIGYERRYYGAPGSDSGIQHASCAEDQAERDKRTAC